jgi:hypothetical protein
MKDVNGSDTQIANTREQAAQQSLTPYSPPVLHVYGPVSRLTMGATGTGADGTMLTMNLMSDRATKENIVRIGTHPLGIGLYLFDYLPEYRDAAGHGRQLGVMADEVETIVPEAVIVHPDGYKMVDYAMLARTQIANTFH